ncbi:MAG: hypothetical protein KA536_11600 [Saprospiraceae bacterium]|nr:hypothetical protein [Saprospiraceae bacterium]
MQELAYSKLFNKENLTFILSVEFDNEKFLKFKEIGKNFINLKLKEEFHLTIVGSSTSKYLSELEFDIFGNPVSNVLETLNEKTKFRIFLKEEYFLVNKKYSDKYFIINNQNIEEFRESIIQIVKCEQIKEYYEALNLHFKTSIPLPLPHITIFTNSNNIENIKRGIGIYSFDEFWKLNPTKL